MYCYNEESLYKSSVGKLLNTVKEKTENSIKFKQMPKENVSYKPNIVHSVFKNNWHAV